MNYAEKLFEKAKIKFNPLIGKRAKYIYLDDYDSAVLEKNKEIDVCDTGEQARAFREQVAEAEKREAKS